MRRLLLCALALAIACGCGGARAETRTPTPQDITPHAAPASVPLSVLLSPIGGHQPPDQLAAIAAFIRRWEQDPFGPVPENDTEMSTPGLMLAWLAGSPDVTVNVCMAVQALADGQGADVGPVVTMGSSFGMAAYLIEHPGARPTSAEVQIGGIESALRWYAASLRRGDGHNTLVDDLAARYASGGTAALLAWWTEHQIVCGEG